MVIIERQSLREKEVLTLTFNAVCVLFLTNDVAQLMEASDQKTPLCHSGVYEPTMYCVV